MKSIGEKVWDRLRAEGGFVWTVADGRKFVRFNRGCHPSAELQSILKRHREDLKAYVDVLHAADMRYAPRVGSSRSIANPAPNGRGGDMRECNAASRSRISQKPAEKADFSGTGAHARALPAVAAVLASLLAACGEIRLAERGRSAAPVGLVTVLSTIYSPGSGEGATTNGGSASWKRS